MHQLQPTGVQLYEKTDEGQLEADAVGRPIVHTSAFKQATGEAVYIDDMPPLHGTLRHFYHTLLFVNTFVHVSDVHF